MAHKRQIEEPMHNDALRGAGEALRVSISPTPLVRSVAKGSTIGTERFIKCLHFPMLEKYVLAIRGAKRKHRR
jgi:hypothetical protein